MNGMLDSVDAIFDASGVDRLRAASFNEDSHKRDKNGRFAPKSESSDGDAEPKRKIVDAGKNIAQNLAADKAADVALGTVVAGGIGLATRKRWQGKMKSLKGMDLKEAKSVFELDGKGGALSTSLSTHVADGDVLNVSGSVLKGGKEVGKWEHTLRDNGMVHFDRLEITDPDSQALGPDLIERQLGKYRSLGATEADIYVNDSIPGSPSRESLKRIGFKMTPRKGRGVINLRAAKRLTSAVDGLSEAMWSHLPE